MAWGAWLEHYQPTTPEDASPCPYCLNAGDPAEGCSEGRRLWGAYRLARITLTGGTRYAVRPLSGRLHWGIYDVLMDAWCSLAIGPNTFAPLEWKSADEASMWLYMCRVAWRNGLVTGPEGWNG
jgi:hypothetical protein